MGRQSNVLVEYGLSADQRAVLEMPVDTYALTQTLSHHFLGLHINKLIFKRGAAGIDNKNFHFFFPSYCK